MSLWVCFSTSPPFHHPSSLSCSTFPSPSLSQPLTFYFSPLTLLLLPSFPASMSFSSSSLPLISPFLPSPCSVRDKFVEVDLKPVCKHCYERLPDDMKRRLAKRERDSKEKKKKLLIPMCLWSSLSPFSSLPLFFLWLVSSSSFCFYSFFLFHCHHISNMLHDTFILSVRLSSQIMKADIR